MNKQMSVIWAVIMVFLVGIGSVIAQDPQVIKMKMEEMEKSAQHLLTMAYRHNVATFAKSLRDMSMGGKLDDLEMARMTLSEINRNMAKMEESHLLHMQTMTSEMNQIMFPQMEKMQAESVLIKEHLAALDKAFQASSPNALDIYKHANESVLILEKTDISEMKDSDMKDNKMSSMTTATRTPMLGNMPQNPTAQPKMKGMKSSENSSKDADMGNEMMGAKGLVPPEIMLGMKGRWMVGYQFMFDKMEGNLVGTRRVTDASVLNRFMAAPTDMTMQMHMGTVMYAPTDKLTLMVMVPYIRKTMNLVLRNGSRTIEQSNGIGDIELRGLYSLYAKEDMRHRFLFNGGIGLPTGSINKKMGHHQLGYPMQLGSGTVSLIPGFTYLGQAKPWGWGAEFIPTVRIGRNSNGYRLGNRYQPSAWVARQLKPWFSLSGRFNGDIWQNIRGADSNFHHIDEPTKDPNLQGGKRLDFTFGTTFHPVEGVLKGNQFFINVNKPIFQTLDGPQLQRSWVIKTGWQKEF